MNAVETLEAAITKLEKLRDDANGLGPRRSDVWPEAAELIVTLHRTIDPVLAVLREAHDRPGWENGELAHAPHAVNLAHAILGDS